MIAKAPCRVILTAPPADWKARSPSHGQPPPVPADEEQQTAPSVDESLAAANDRGEAGAR